MAVCRAFEYEFFLFPRVGEEIVPTQGKGRGGENNGTEKRLFHSEGVTYFNKQTERKIFFILTLIMLGWGVFAKFGVLWGV